MYGVCVRKCPYQSLKQRHQYANWPQKGRRVFNCVWWVAWKPVRREWFDAREKNLWKILNMWHAVSRYQHDGTHGSGEGRNGPAMWPPGYELQEGGSLTRHWIENTRRWDRKTRLTSMIYWSVGCCTYLLKKVCLKRAQNIAIHKLDSSTEARIKRWLKQFQQDVSGSSMVTESLKSLSSGIPARRVSVTTVFYIA